VRRYQKGKTNLDFTEARDSGWQWHQLGRMQVCTLLQQITTPAPHHSCFLQAGCPSCRPANSVKALKANSESANTTTRELDGENECQQPPFYSHYTGQPALAGTSS